MFVCAYSIYFVYMCIQICIYVCIYSLSTVCIYSVYIYCAVICTEAHTHIYRPTHIYIHLYQFVYVPMSHTDIYNSSPLFRFITIFSNSENSGSQYQQCTYLFICSILEYTSSSRITNLYFWIKKRSTNWSSIFV